MQFLDLIVYPINFNKPLRNEHLMVDDDDLR